MRTHLLLIGILACTACNPVTEETSSAPPPPLQVDCLEGDYTLQDDADAAAFDRVPCVIGDLWIAASGATEVSLPSLVSVTGAFVIGYHGPVESNTTLTALDLPALESVGGELYVGANDVLESLNLARLAYVSANGTTDMAGLEVTGNARLTHLDLPALVGVGGEMEHWGSVRITENDTLSAVDLSGLVSIAGDEGGDGLIVKSNPELTTFSLPALESAWGRIHIDDNDALTGIHLGVTERLTELTVSGNGSLPNLVGLEHIVSVQGPLSITQNAMLRDLGGLEGLGGVGGTVSVDGNDNLERIDLPNLLVIWGDLDLTSNPVAVSLPSLVEVDGHILIAGYSFPSSTPDRLTELDLRALATVSGDVTLESNDVLDELSLPGLTSVGGTLQLGCSAKGCLGNYQLARVDLGALAAVGGLEIVQNPELDSLGGLGALTSVNGGIVIAENPVLPQCEVCDLIDQLVGFTGSVESWDNQPDTCTDVCD